MFVFSSLEDFYFNMSASDEFQEARSNRKRKRETNEENTTMETEQSSTAQFPQLNPSQLKVKFYFYKTFYLLNI